MNEISQELEVVKAQCASFWAARLGHAKLCFSKQSGMELEPWVDLWINQKQYKLADPDIYVIMGQLAHIYQRLKLNELKRARERRA
jgi:hypothetical protein